MTCSSPRRHLSDLSLLPRYVPPAPLEAESSVVIGERYRPGREEVRCQGSQGCGQEARMMMMMDTSNLPVIGIASRRGRGVVKRRRKLRVLDN